MREEEGIFIGPSSIKISVHIPSAYETFSKLRVQNKQLYKAKSTEIISTIFSDDDTSEMEINHKGQQQKKWSWAEKLRRVEAE